jgi:hypothetical protein
VKIVFDNVGDFMRRLEDQKRRLEEKTSELVKRLADYGVEIADISFGSAPYDGVNDVKVDFEEYDEFTRAVVAAGNAVLFIEFGAGVTYGYGHPEPQGYGPGTYPGKGHWDDPNGWYYAHDKRSYGNPPSASMYNARKQIEEDFTRIAQEVFRD